MTSIRRPLPPRRRGPSQRRLRCHRTNARAGRWARRSTPRRARPRRPSRLPAQSPHGWPLRHSATRAASARRPRRGPRCRFGGWMLRRSGAPRWAGQCGSNRRRWRSPHRSPSSSRSRRHLRRPHRRSFRRRCPRCPRLWRLRSRDPPRCPCPHPRRRRSYRRHSRRRAQIDHRLTACRRGPQRRSSRRSLREDAGRNPMCIAHQCSRRAWCRRRTRLRRRRRCGVRSRTSRPRRQTRPPRRRRRPPRRTLRRRRQRR